MASLLYGGGLRVMECVELRVKDVQFDRGELVVREGKGDKDRVTMLPRALSAPLADHLAHRKRMYERDLPDGHGDRGGADQSGTTCRLSADARSHVGEVAQTVMGEDQSGAHVVH